MEALAPPACTPPERAYRRRRPERGVLHRVLSEHLATFLARGDSDETRAGLPRYVRRELSAYLRCGILAHGFARVRCGSCGKDALVAFSCKGRGFCPSCGGRRMAETAAHLVDRVLPDVPVRQWVLSMPWRLRFLLASDPALTRAVRRSFLRAVFASYRARAERDGVAAGRTGAVNVVQRFGSALNLNVHFHALVLDGVYTAESPFARPVFHPAGDLEDEEVARLVQTLRDRIVRLLRRRGLWPAPGEEGGAGEHDDDSLLPFLSAASIQGRVALGPDAGRRIERLGHAPSDAPSFEPGALCAAIDGFSLHAQVQVEAGDRERLEHLCRYVARPPIATERLSLSSEGKVVYELRRPWRDGTTHFVFEPLTFLERLAALVPHPREHMVTYHGVLASAASWRDMIVPAPDESDDEPPTIWHPEPRAPAATPSPVAPRPAPEPHRSEPHRYRWSELLRRVFEIDVLHCDHCGGRRELIALITHPVVVRRILRHLELPSEPLPIAPARPPPQMAFAF